MQPEINGEKFGSSSPVLATEDELHPVLSNLLHNARYCLACALWSLPTRRDIKLTFESVAEAEADANRQSWVSLPVENGVPAGL